MVAVVVRPMAAPLVGVLPVGVPPVVIMVVLPHGNHWRCKDPQWPHPLQHHPLVAIAPGSSYHWWHHPLLGSAYPSSTTLQQHQPQPTQRNLALLGAAWHHLTLPGAT